MYIDNDTGCTDLGLATEWYVSLKVLNIEYLPNDLFTNKYSVYPWSDYLESVGENKKALIIS